MSIIFSYHKKFPNEILIRKITGLKSAEEILSSLKYMSEELLPQKKIKGIINDLLECELEMNRENFSSLLQFINLQKNLNGIKMAVVTNNPKTIVFPILAESENDNIKAFSSYQAAESWILK